MAEGGKTQKQAAGETSCLTKQVQGLNSYESNLSKSTKSHSINTYMVYLEDLGPHGLPCCFVWVLFSQKS